MKAALLTMMAIPCPKAEGGDPAPLDEKFIDDAIGRVERVDETVE
jgi:hypothetical protein